MKEKRRKKGQEMRIYIPLQTGTKRVPRLILSLSFYSGLTVAV